MTESAICRRPPKEHPGARALNLDGNGFKDCGLLVKACVSARYSVLRMR